MSARSIEEELHKLTGLSRSGLVERWKELVKSDPPKGISGQLMIRAIAYEMQVKRFGGLKPATLKRLRKIAASLEEGRPSSPADIQRSAPSPNPGTRLVREWNGTTHVVDVTVDGFEWQGKSYGSLSAIAREITGARWSGPRFFGLSGRGAQS